jgi:hypothetical protein
MPRPAYLRDHIREMEKRPFDGVILRVSDEAGAGNVFDVKKWSAIPLEARACELQVCAQIPPGKTFTDNFLAIYGASTMDWFSETDWKRVLEHVRFAAKAAKAARCKGICWDPEPYGGINPWRYREQPGREKRTLAEYAAQARKRGAQFMRALQEEFPGLTFLTLRLLSDFQDGSPFSESLFAERDPKKRQEILNNAWWGLHPAFLNGLLDAVQPDTVIIDGNEDAYYYTSALEFYRVGHVLRHEALVLIAPENHRKYRAQVRGGHAVSVDYTQGRWAEGLNFPDYLRKQATLLTREQRLQWFEHNVYYALSSAEEYVWCYNEDMNWWENRNIPEGLEAALRRARQKYETGQPLGFQIESLLQNAREQLKAKQRKD